VALPCSPDRGIMMVVVRGNDRYRYLGGGKGGGLENWAGLGLGPSNILPLDVHRSCIPIYAQRSVQVSCGTFSMTTLAPLHANLQAGEQRKIGGVSGLTSERRGMRQAWRAYKRLWR